MRSDFACCLYDDDVFATACHAFAISQKTRSCLCASKSFKNLFIFILLSRISFMYLILCILLKNLCVNIIPSLYYLQLAILLRIFHIGRAMLTFVEDKTNVVATNDGRSREYVENRIQFH